MVAPRDDIPRIPQFFAGRSVLITGATGFVGKVLVERLLSTCPEVSRVHLLLRNKKGNSPAARLTELKQSQVFDVIRVKCPWQLEKLVAIPGDTALPGLGLPAQATTMLQDVSVVFHSAATLKFDEELRVAIDQNVLSVTRLLEICDQLPNMQAFVHVSTAYSNADLTSIGERVYTPPKTLAAAIALADHVPSDLVSQIVPKFIAPKPNTYTFTKALAESEIEKHGNKGYSISIFRPSIVISSLRDPFPGWVENLNGPTGIVVGVGKGLLHVFPSKTNARADFLPVDIAVDTLLAVAWETAVDKSDKVRVYNCSTCENPTTIRLFEKILREYSPQHPMDNALWYPSGCSLQNEWAMKTAAFFLQTVPLHIAEYGARLTGMKTKINLITANQRLTAMSDALMFFSTREWYFETNRVKALKERLSPADAKIFNLDVHSINWDDHLKNFIKGTRKYLLREKDHDIEKARTHMWRLWILHYTMKILTLVLFLRLILQNKLARSLVYGTLRLLLSLFSTAYSTLKAN